VLSTINHIEAWHRKSVRVGVSSKISIVLVKRNSFARGTSLGCSK
jgi:hypothetical protein